MKEKRGQWYLLTGILVGFLAGLAVAWIVQPVEYVDTSPASLRSSYKEYYRILIATSYAASGDLVRAKARLELLGDEDPLQALTEQAQRTLAGGSSPDEARALSLLAAALNHDPVGGAGANPTLPTQPGTSTPQTPQATGTQSDPALQDTP